MVSQKCDVCDSQQGNFEVSVRTNSARTERGGGSQKRCLERHASR